MKTIVFLNKKKIKKREYGRERYKAISKNKKERLVEYKKDVMLCTRLAHKL